MTAIQSMLFVPGAKPERFAKALSSGADCVCIDLEDSVPPAGKDAARGAALAALGPPRLALRINGLTTREGLKDLLVLADAGVRPAALFLPKVESPVEIAQVRSILGADAPGIVPLIETVKGLEAAAAIAREPGVVMVMFGGGDLSAELGVDLAWMPLLHARSQLVQACAGAGVPALDVPFIAIGDETGLEAECRLARQLGFAAKAAIHPAQVATIHAVFRPGPAEIAEAEAAEAAFAAAGGAAVSFNGKMLEAPVMRRYRQVLALKGRIDA